MSKSQTHRSKRIAMTSNAPRTAIRDAVLAEASANVDDHEIIDAVLWLVEEDARTATITGAGPMVGFHDFKEVAL